MIVPLGTQNSINTLTLSIDETQISQKTVYIYVQDSFRVSIASRELNAAHEGFILLLIIVFVCNQDIDDVRPTIEYSFNSNCAGKLNKDRCDKTFWSADVIVQDSDSGLCTTSLIITCEFLRCTLCTIVFFANRFEARAIDSKSNIPTHRVHKWHKRANNILLFLFMLLDVG